VVVLAMKLEKIMGDPLFLFFFPAPTGGMAEKVSFAKDIDGNSG
jgi:hypothetical protein